MEYLFLIQNTISKQVYYWQLDDLAPEGIYHKFDIQLEEGMKDGEYEWLLIPNPNKLEVEINVNNIFKSCLIGGDTEIETFGLLRIGRNRCKIRYSPEQKYIIYGR